MLISSIFVNYSCENLFYIKWYLNDLQIKIFFREEKKKAKTKIL